MGQGWNRLQAGSWYPVFSLLGGIYVALGIGRVLHVVTGSELLLTGAIDFLLVGGPGFVLLYGGYRLPRIGIDPDTYPRILGWCVLGFSLAFGLIELLHLEPGVTFRYPRWSLMFSSSLATASGFIIGVYDARSITQAQRLHHQYRQLQQQQQQLQQQQEELQRQNERLDNFANLLAHELRNPLSIARIYLRPAMEGDTSAGKEVENALTRIGEMVDIILVIARGEDADINREVVSLAAVAEEVWADLDFTNADLTIESEQTLLADPIHLRHLLENLFTNAVDHADEHVSLRLGELPSGFYVEDTGPGIPADERDKIFKPGYTTDGTGFGLVFVAELAETYGWEYSVTEGTDGGARFEFTGVDCPSPRKTRKH